MLRQMRLLDLLNATSSPGSESGPTPCDVPDGPTTIPPGPALAPANLSARQAKEAGLLTSGTFGRLGSISSNSAALQSSLVNRLALRCAMDGSTLFNLTWKELATPSGRPFSRLAASARRISENGFGSWPTPMAGTPAQNGNNEAGNSDFSRKTVALTAWPTPKASDCSGGRTTETAGGGNAHLDKDARLASWSTPLQNDGQSTHSYGKDKAVILKLPGQAKLSGPARLTASGKMLTGSAAEMESGGQLSQAHSRWLQALPTSWDLAAPSKENPAPKCSGATGTPSTRKQRKPLLAPTSKHSDLGLAELSQAIPPAYSEFLAKAAIAATGVRNKGFFD